MIHEKIWDVPITPEKIVRIFLRIVVTWHIQLIKYYTPAQPANSPHITSELNPYGEILLIVRNAAKGGNTPIWYTGEDIETVFSTSKGLMTT